MNMKTNNFIIAAVAATLALTSCNKQEELYELEQQAEVRINDGSSFTTTCWSQCDSANTYQQFEYKFAVPYVVNIGKIPFIESIYDNFEFYALHKYDNTTKLTGFAACEKDIAGDIQDMIVKVVSNDIEFDQVVLYIPSSKINDYDFFVQKGDQVVQLNVTEIY